MQAKSTNFTEILQRIDQLCPGIDTYVPNIVLFVSRYLQVC